MQPTTLTPRKQSGNQAENLAKDFLERQGLRFCGSNFQCKTGEIDLIMQDAEMLVFVEVRYRASTDHGSPAETVTYGKQRKLIRTASYFLQQEYGDRWPPCRFDVLGISGDLEARPDIFWIPAAFY